MDSSPNDMTYEVEKKVLEYLSAGVALVWVINPEARNVHIHRQDGTVARLRDVDELSGENVIPGFRCPVADFFPPKPAEPPAAG
jgi:Uma2 family endonuclease